MQQRNGKQSGKQVNKKANLNRGTKRKSNPYTGPKLKQQGNHNTLHEGQKFFVRALNHCYHQIEEQMRLISKTPAPFQKALRIKKARLQREAEYILNTKLKGVQV